MISTRQMARWTALAAGLLGFALTAQAHSDVSWSVTIGSPGTVWQAPVAPPAYYGTPVYVQPPPVYVRPQPVYVQPAPIYRVQRPGYRAQWQGHRPAARHDRRHVNRHGHDRRSHGQGHRPHRHR